MLYGGVLGEKLAEYMAEEGGLITLEDLKSYAIEERYKGPVAGCPTLGTRTQPATIQPPHTVPRAEPSLIAMKWKSNRVWVSLLTEVVGWRAVRYVPRVSDRGLHSVLGWRCSPG